MAVHPALSAIHEATLSYLHPTGTNTTSAHELELAVETLLATVHRAVAETLSQWNARTDDVWRRLPAELYADCFKHLEMKDKLAVTHTSRMWRSNALSIPTLWSTIHSTGSFNLDKTLVQTMLRRSGSSALSLTLDADIAEDQTTLDQLSQNIRRVKSLVVTGSNGSHFMDMLLPPPQAPLPRLETLELSEVAQWGHPERSISGLFPCLRFLRITEAFEGLFHPMPHLQELSCAFWPQTDGRQIFRLCTNLRKLTITPVGTLEVKMLPQGRPPASLQKFKLNDKEGYGMAGPIPGFFGPWAGQAGLRSLKLIGMSEQLVATVVALFKFSSICSGPTKMSITASDYYSGINIRMGDDTRRFGVDGAVTNDALLDVFIDGAQYLSNLHFVDIPGYVFEDMLVNGTVTFPAVKGLRIALEGPDLRSGFNGSCIDRLLALDLNSIGGLRAPCLQYFTFGTNEPFTLSKVFSFARLLPKAIQFDRLCLTCLIFSGVPLESIAACTSGIWPGDSGICSDYVDTARCMCHRMYITDYLV